MASLMDCDYALKDEEFPGRGFVTICDCPGGCPYKKHRDYIKGEGLGECTKVVPFDQRSRKADFYAGL